MDNDKTGESNSGIASYSRRALLGLTVAAVGAAAACGVQAQVNPSDSPSATKPGKGKGKKKPPLVPEPVASRNPVRNIHDLVPDAPDNAIALTIDDGPHPLWTPQVLEVLRKYDVQATFFVIGAQAHGRPYLAKAITDDGHSLANHTMHHPVNLGTLGQTALNKELVDASNAIYEAVGQPPRLFRSPGGSWNKAVLSAAAANGMLPIDWDIDPRDWSRPGIQVITQRLLAAKPGDVLLCHDGGGDRSQTLAALKATLPVLKSRGLQFITF